MSENRFRITTNPKSKAVAFDEKQKKHYIGIDLEDLLNEQYMKIKDLQEENEQLKKQVKKLKIENEALQDSNDALAEDRFHRLEEVI